MNLLDITITVGLALLVVGAYAGLIAARSWIKQSSLALEDTQLGWMIEHLVHAAEEQNKIPGQGQAKFDWVIAQLDQRFDGFDEELARTIIKAAVYRMNNQKPPVSPAPPLTEGRGDQIPGALKP